MKIFYVYSFIFIFTSAFHESRYKNTIFNFLPCIVLALYLNYFSILPGYPVLLISISCNFSSSQCTFMPSISWFIILFYSSMSLIQFCSENGVFFSPTFSCNNLWSVHFIFFCYNL